MGHGVNARGRKNHGDHHGGARRARREAGCVGVAVHNEDERRKALLAYLREGLPCIVWDNIPRSTRFKCSHFERAATSEIYSDRLLGKSDSVFAPAHTIQVFTGNDVAPDGDYPSRSLSVSLSVDQPDPENRDFVHPDPIQWTLDHRGNILNALYTILLGNPPPEAGCRIQTRFKPWQRLVGSAVEHAAATEGHAISFAELFASVEASDEERVNWAKTLAALDAVMKPGAARNGAAMLPTEFMAKDVLKMLNDSARAAIEARELENEHVAHLRQFCMPRSAKEPSVRSIGRSLTGIVGAPVDVETSEETVRMTLRSRPIRNENHYSLARSPVFRRSAAASERSSAAKANVDADDEPM